MPKVQSKKLRFGSYDFSNSGYVLIFQSFLFPLVLAKATSNESHAQTLWAWIVTCSSIAAIVGAPFVGRFADLLGKWRVFASAVVVTGILASVSPIAFAKNLLLLAMSFLVFNTIFEWTQSLYDSFLLNFGNTRAEITSLSTFGWGFGYVGGALFAVAYLILSKKGVSSSASLALLGVLFLLTSIPAILTFRRAEQEVRRTYTRPNLKKILSTSSPVPWRELLIYWVIADSTAAVIYFAPLYMQQEIGLTTQRMGMLFLAAQVVAFPMTILMGKFAVMTGTVKVIRWCLLIWLAAVIGLYLAHSLRGLIPVMFAFSLVIGSTQAILRAHYASRIKLEHSGEGLGYFAVAQKSASVAAPAMVAGVLMLGGTLRSAFLVLAVFILLAFLVAFRLPETPSRLSTESEETS